MVFQRKKCILLRQTLGDIMKWEDILKISAGERSDAERFADPKDLLMNDSEMRRFVLSQRKRLKNLMDRPKQVKERFKNKRPMPRMAEIFAIKEVKAIMGMNLDFLDKKLKNIEDELNREAPNMFKIKRMKESYVNAYKDMTKPLRDIQREKSNMRKNR